MINLIKNAIDALAEKESPKIILSAGTDASNQSFIQVRDNGKGIEPEILDQIFIPFYTTKT